MQYDTLALFPYTVWSLGSIYILIQLFSDPILSLVPVLCIVYLFQSGLFICNVLSINCHQMSDQSIFIFLFFNPLKHHKAYAHPLYCNGQSC